MNSTILLSNSHKLVKLWPHLRNNDNLRSRGHHIHQSKLHLAALFPFSASLQILTAGSRPDNVLLTWNYQTAPAEFIKFR